jgi:hypothetical protein
MDRSRIHAMIALFQTRFRRHEGNEMKNIVVGLILATVATSAMAGAMLEPVMEPGPIVEQASAHSFDHDILVPLVILAFMGIVLFF